MPDGLEARLRWLFGGVAVVLVATGAFALLVTSTSEPAQASQTLNDAQLHALVVATLAAAVTAFVILGSRVVWAPRRNTHLMPVFALASLAAFACEATVALQAWRSGASWTDAASVAGASLVLALASVLGWISLWLAERPGDATARRDAALFAALRATLVPAGQGLDLDASDDAVTARIVAAFAARSTRRRPALRLALRTLDAVALVKHRSRFDAADQALRERIVAGLATSRRPRLRALGATLTGTVAGAFWADARVRAAVGDDALRVQSLLESGANAAAHRARREAAEQAALEAALAAQGLVSEGTPVAADTIAAEAAAEPAEAPGARHREQEAQPAPRPPASSSTEPAPASATAQPASDGPKEIAPHAGELPFDRPWTLGVPAQEAVARPAMGSVLSVARSGGPTRR